MFRPIETTELSMEETHYHVLQFVYGTRNLWRQGRDGCLLTKNQSFFSVQPARDANAYCNMKLLDQHYKLVEQNKVVMLILFNRLVMLITLLRVAVAVCITRCLNRLFWWLFSSGLVIYGGSCNSIIKQVKLLSETINFCVDKTFMKCWLT